MTIKEKQGISKQSLKVSSPKYLRIKKERQFTLVKLGRHPKIKINITGNNIYRHHPQSKQRKHKKAKVRVILKIQIQNILKVSRSLKKKLKRLEKGHGLKEKKELDD